MISFSIVFPFIGSWYLPVFVGSVFGVVGFFYSLKYKTKARASLPSTGAMLNDEIKGKLDVVAKWNTITTRYFEYD